MEWKTFFKKLNQIPLYLTLFLIPLLFLPFTQNVLDFPKQVFFSILILLSLIGWTGKIIFERKLFLNQNKIFYLSLLLIFLSLSFSLFFSLNIRFSIFGSPIEISDCFFTSILFLIFVFLLFNSFETKVEFLYLIFFLFSSSALVGILNFFQIYQIFIFPFDFSKNPSFNLIGTPNSLAIFESLIFPISLILFFKSKGNLKIILGIISIIIFLNILLINFKTAWSILIVETLVLFTFSEKVRFDFLSVLMVIFVFSIFFYLFPLPFPGFPRLPPEISLSFPAEFYLIKNAFSKSFKNLILGSGPATFIFDYSLYRSPLLNQTIFWGTRFSKGHSMFFDWLLTKGVLGGISLLLLFIFSIFFFFSKLDKKERDEFFEIKVGLISALFGSIFSFFFYPFNFSLSFIFWFLVGATFFFFNKKFLVIDFSSVGKNFFANLIFVLVALFSLCLIFIQSQKYLAEVYYLKSVKSFQIGNLDLALNYLQKAINFNSSIDFYWRDLSQIYLAKANAISQDPNLSLEEKRNLANSAIIFGAQAINRAINILPQNVANWNVRGFFYQNLVGIEGAAQESLNSYQMAIQLEPNSPYSFTEKGRVYILMAQDFAKKGDEKSQKENLNFAISILQKALELKSDYAPAHYLLAVVFDQLGEGERAIAKLEEAKSIAPQDFGLAFQLGILYWRKENFSKAKEEFERAISINPDYSNAHYMLGLVYEKMGEKEKAISEIEKVVKLNPQSEEAKKILENLKKGLPPLEEITLPIQENPPEIKP